MTPFIPPAIILVEPQLSQNLGTTARAMLNFGFTDLRLVRPSADPLSRDARALAAGADCVLEKVRLFTTTAQAVADLQIIYATTARPRDMVGLHMTPVEAVRHMTQYVSSSAATVGILFGPERAGLTNEDVALCNVTVSVPLNPAFSSLNLAQAVLLLCYEFYQVSHQSDKAQAITFKQGESLMASKQDVQQFFDHLIDELDQAHYFRTTHKRPKMIQSLYTMFSRISFTAQEVRTLRGVISTLVRSKKAQTHSSKNYLSK